MYPGPRQVGKDAEINASSLAAMVAVDGAATTGVVSLFYRVLPGLHTLHVGLRIDQPKAQIRFARIYQQETIEGDKFHLTKQDVSPSYALRGSFREGITIRLKKVVYNFEAGRRYRLRAGFIAGNPDVPSLPPATTAGQHDDWRVWVEAEVSTDTWQPVSANVTDLGWDEVRRYGKLRELSILR